MGNCLITKLAEAVDIEHPIYIDGQIVYFRVGTANVNNHDVMASGKFKLELLDGDAYFVANTTSTTSIGTVLNFDTSKGSGGYTDGSISIVASRTGDIRAKLTYVDGFAVRQIQNLKAVDWDDIYAHNASGVNVVNIALGNNANNSDSAVKFTSSVDKCTPLVYLTGNIGNLDAKVNLNIDHFANNTVITNVQFVKNCTNPDLILSGSLLNLKSIVLTSINFYNNNFEGVSLTGSLEGWAAQQVSLGRTSGKCLILAGNTGVEYNGSRITGYVTKYVHFNSSYTGGYQITDSSTSPNP